MVYSLFITRYHFHRFEEAAPHFTPMVGHNLTLPFSLPDLMHLAYFQLRWHHSITLIFVWKVFPYSEPIQRFYGVMNFAVHG